MSSHSVTSLADENGVEETLDAHTTILRWIAGLLTAGAAWMLAPILVPFVLAWPWRSHFRHWPGE